MEKKNTVLLTIVAIATLLVAIVGATFAYFTATTQIGGEGTGSGVADVGTATVSGARLELAPTDTVTYLAYPGGFAYTAISADAVKVDPELDPNQYAVSYRINLEFTNNTKTYINWYLYRSNEKITNAKTCELQTDAHDTETRYYYVCDGSNGTYGGEQVTGATGIITPGADHEEIIVSDIQTLKTTEPTYYYYLVVEYPDTDLVQNADEGKTISAAITGVSSLSAVASN